MELKEIIIEKIKSTFPDALSDITEFRDDLALTVQAAHIVEICRLLKEDQDLEFHLCEDVTAIDWAKKKNRFTVVYHIYSFKNKFRLRLRTNLEGEETDSVSSIWRSANWYERETFDMYGIKFRNHPDLRRIYMPETFQYYPLRKEFPLLGIPGSLTLPKK